MQYGIDLNLDKWFLLLIVVKGFHQAVVTDMNSKMNDMILRVYRKQRKFRNSIQEC